MQTEAQDNREMLYDRDIREPLFDFLEERYGKVRIIEEKQMGRSRADLMMVLPEALVGIEIKSDADTYARLERQVKDYNHFFDRNFVVVGTRHAMHIEEHVPQWWGIITVESEDGVPDFYVLRDAGPNPEMDAAKKLELLWRPELAHIQALNALPRYEQKSKAFVIGKILEHVPGEILRAQVSEELFERDYQEIGQEIAAYRASHGARNKAAGKRKRRKPRR